MWVSIGNSPNIVRCWGKGTAHEIGTPGFKQIVGDKPLIPVSFPRRLIHSSFILTG
jgi:hypothetical protein